jgi:hypothetical protein
MQTQQMGLPDVRIDEPVVSGGKAQSDAEQGMPRSQASSTPPKGRNVGIGP